MTEAKRELNLIETFLMAFYHEHSDLIGTTRALDALRPSSEYRRELGYAFKHLLGARAGVWNTASAGA